MAATAEGGLLTKAQYQAQLATRAKLLTSLQTVYDAYPVQDFATVAPMADTSAALVEASFITSASIASDYLVAFGTVETGTAVAPVVATAPTTAVISSRLASTTIATIIRAQAAGLAIDVAKRLAWVNMSGYASSMALAGGQTTITNSVARWQRVTSAKPCAFCAMLASRGPVYRESTVRFQAHPHCACSAEPAFTSGYTSANSRWADLWTAATGGLSGADALNAFRRALS